MGHPMRRSGDAKTGTIWINGGPVDGRPHGVLSLVGVAVVATCLGVAVIVVAGAVCLGVETEATGVACPGAETEAAGVVCHGVETIGVGVVIKDGGNHMIMPHNPVIGQHLNNNQL